MLANILDTSEKFSESPARRLCALPCRQVWRARAEQTTREVLPAGVLGAQLGRQVTVAVLRDVMLTFPLFNRLAANPELGERFLGSVALIINEVRPLRGDRLSERFGSGYCVLDRC